MIDITDILWTREEVAKFLKVKESVVKCWMKSEDLPYIKIGRHPRFDPVDVKQWLEDRKVGTRANDPEKALHLLT